MTQNEIYNALHRGGAFSLPYLITLSHPSITTLYFVNNNEDVIYDGHTFKATSFKYTRPKTIGGVLKNGSLELTEKDNANGFNEIAALIEKVDERLIVNAVGVINDAGDVTPIKAFKHQYGTATINENMTLSIQFTNDDRLGMSFPPYIFDAENNRGNA